MYIPLILRGSPFTGRPCPHLASSRAASSSPEVKPPSLRAPPRRSATLPSSQPRCRWLPCFCRRGANGCADRGGGAARCRLYIRVDGIQKKASIRTRTAATRRLRRLLHRLRLRRHRLRRNGWFSRSSMRGRSNNGRRWRAEPWRLHQQRRRQWRRRGRTALSDVHNTSEPPWVKRRRERGRRQCKRRLGGSWRRGRTDRLHDLACAARRGWNVGRDASRSRDLRRGGRQIDRRCALLPLLPPRA